MVLPLEHRTLPGLVSELHAICASAVPEEEGPLVRRLLDLACSMPAASTVIAADLDEPLLRHWMASGASLSVAAALLGSTAGFMLSRGGGSSAMATVVAEGLNEEFSCLGETDAIALCGAICAALAKSLSMMEQAGPSTLVH